MLGRREAWPAAVILFIGTLTLGITLKAAQQNMPLQPTWVMGVLAGLYVVLAVIAGGRSWRTPVVLTGMLVAQVVMALLMGWGYAAVEGRGLDAYQALVHGLWNYVPGLALQFGFACVFGIVLHGQLEPADVANECEADPEEGRLLRVPDLSAVENIPAALVALTALPGISGALLAGVEVFGAGVWERDPEAALGRVQALLSRTGSGLNAFPLSAVNLLTRSEHGRVAALLVAEAVHQETAHALLRELWNVGERLWPTEPVAE